MSDRAQKGQSTGIREADVSEIQTADGWLVVAAADGQMNVMPRSDVRPHQTGPRCWCRPTDDEGVLVHHSVDRREEYEEGRKLS